MNPTNAPPISITPHHLHLSPSLRDFAYSKLAKVPRFSSDALRMDLVLRRHGGASEEGRFSASARVALPGRDIHASAAHADLYSAIVKLVDRLARHSRKRKTRRARVSRTLRGSARWNGPGTLPDALDSGAEFSESLDGFAAARSSLEAASPYRGLSRPGNTSRKTVGLVERSSSSNPAHGVALNHLKRLAASSRARASARA
jgi:putative sigma-54 modulation protein